MDGPRFDRFVQALAAGTSRRRALQGLAGAAGLFAHRGTKDVAAACVKPGKKGCQGPNGGKCCDGRCQGGNAKQEGKCVCKRGLTACGRACVNTKTDEGHCDRCNQKCGAGGTCDRGTCVSVLGCRAGDDTCSDLTGSICPGTGNAGCACVTDVNGIPHCSDLNDSACTKNADCTEGFVCVNGAGPVCECDLQPGSNGNACVRATCDDISGSSAGDGGTVLNRPLLR